MRSKLFVVLFVVMMLVVRARRSGDPRAAAHAGARCSGRADRGP